MTLISASILPCRARQPAIHTLPTTICKAAIVIRMIAQVLFATIRPGPMKCCFRQCVFGSYEILKSGGERCCTCTACSTSRVNPIPGLTSQLAWLVQFVGIGDNCTMLDGIAFSCTSVSVFRIARIILVENCRACTALCVFQRLFLCKSFASSAFCTWCFSEII